MPLRFLKEGMDFAFGNTEHESVDTEEKHSDHDVTGAVVDVRSFGADPTGSDSSTQALEDAVSAANGGDTVLFRDGEFTFDEQVEVNKQLTFKCSNAVLDYSGPSYGGVINFVGGGETDVSTTFASAPSPGDQTISVSDSSGFEAGDDLYIYQGTDEEGGDYLFQFAEIRSVDGSADELRLNGQIRKEFETSATVSEVDLIDGPEFVNTRVRGGGENNQQLRFWFCKNPVFRNCTLSECYVGSLVARDCWNVKMENPTVIGAQAFEGGQGEAIRIQRSDTVSITNPVVSEMRRAIDLMFATNVTIDNPQFANMRLSGIGDHNRMAQNVTVNGGEIRTQIDSPHEARGIDTQHERSTGWTINGTRITASGHCLYFGSENVSATDVDLTPTSDGSSAATAITIEDGAGSVDVSGDVSIPEPAYQTRAVQLQTTTQEIESVDIDIDISCESVTASSLEPFVRVTTSGGYDLRDVDLFGSIRSDSGHTTDAVNIDGDSGVVRNLQFGMDVREHGDRIIHLRGDSGYDRIVVQGVEMDADGRCIHISSPDASSTATDVRVLDSTLSSASADEIQFDNSNTSQVWISRNKCPVMRVSSDVTTGWAVDNVSDTVDVPDGFEERGNQA